MKIFALFAVVAFAACGMANTWRDHFNSDGSSKPLNDPAESTIWPNKWSRANSDSWLVKNHDRLKVMKPRILVVNFVNGLEESKAMEKIEKTIYALSQCTRYHGYKDKEAPAFLQPVLWKYVDLGDSKGKPMMASDLAPRHKELPKGEFNCDYAAFYSDEFAKLYGICDPKNKNHFLNLKELIDQGYVHEMWIIGNDDGVWNTYECVELKQCYDQGFKKIPNKAVQAGNGLTDQPWTGRSFKINYVSWTRGCGCAMEDLAHSWEHVALSNAIPYLSKYMKEYCGFDLDKRFRMPFDSFYALKNEWLKACAPNVIIDYPDENTAVITHDGQKYTIKDYICIGGNVHFPPNGQANYDMFNSKKPVMSTIESYRMANWYDGRDEPKPWTCDVLKVYDYLAPDCMGRWIVYWRQNMPGYQNKAWDDDNKPMKNWWPFLYY